MKNAIAYYYNLYSYDIHQYNDTYRFKVNEKLYVLTPCEEKELEKIYEIYSTLLKYGIPLHYIVPNINNEMLTQIDNKQYILLYVYNNYNQKVEIQDIINFTNMVSNIDIENKKNQDWAILWSNKIDYFEYQVNQFGKKYPKIRESFGYYTGVVETGIQLYRVINDPNSKQIVCHKRINTNSTLYDLYNPLNLIVDHKVRDMAEYFKDLFLIEEDIYETIIKYFEWNYLSGYEGLMFFNRMLYPSFYFDEYEVIIANFKESDRIYDIVSKTDKYEILLKKIYLYLANRINIQDIEWLKKV